MKSHDSLSQRTEAFSWKLVANPNGALTSVDLISKADHHLNQPG
ncbi:hypothetical protein ACFODZ_03985 [Marinicella sediminis]|uniref:Uncharacterized protein n=1 Tax=Marinicella sediminis TaxID=1792834 RepID=A0ABV7J5H0_9GAMM|nr:hypothetical protein [Marinicella sediminis]